MKNHHRGARPKGLPAQGSGSDASPGRSERALARPTVRFCLVFLVLIVLFSSLTSSRLIGVVLHERLTRLIATLSASILAFLGDASSSGPDLSFGGFHASVDGACDGLQPTYIYVAAVLAFPSRWRDKGWGILIGIPAIFLINLIRVVTMMLCGAYWPDLFEWVHLYGWQALVIALTMAVWVFWAELFVRPRDQATT
jgi:exosortase H (IPTLxxWG-CTERM-specific)